MPAHTAHPVANQDETSEEGTLIVMEDLSEDSLIERTRNTTVFQERLAELLNIRDSRRVESTDYDMTRALLPTIPEETKSQMSTEDAVLIQIEPEEKKDDEVSVNEEDCVVVAVGEDAAKPLPDIDETLRLVYELRAMKRALFMVHRVYIHSKIIIKAINDCLSSLKAVVEASPFDVQLYSEELDNLAIETEVLMAKTIEEADRIEEMLQSLEEPCSLQVEEPMSESDIEKRQQADRDDREYHQLNIFLIVFFAVLVIILITKMVYEGF